MTAIRSQVRQPPASVADGRRWRTQEKTLNLLALLGGWPGG